MEDTTKTEAGVVADLARKAAFNPIILNTVDGREILVTPDDMTWSDISDPNATPDLPPKHVVQAVVVQTEDSLVDYVNRFKTEETTLFADIDVNKILGIVDYHAPSPMNDTGAEANHTDHTVTLHLPFAFEWKTWTAIDGKLMGQLEFARFLEENAADITAPDAATLLEACRDLHAVRKADFTKAVRTASDNENFEYVEETELRGRQNGGIEIPKKFQLSIPVYFGDPPTELHAFLRWKLDDGVLLLGIALHRAEHARQAVFKKHVTAAADRTGCQAIFGRP